MDKYYLLILTLCLTLLFFVGGAKHLVTLHDSTGFLATLIPFNYFPYIINFIVILVASLIEFLVPVFVIYSIITEKMKKEAKIALYALMFFLACTLIFVHNPFYENQLNPFLANLAILSGLYLLDSYL